MARKLQQQAAEATRDRTIRNRPGEWGGPTVDQLKLETANDIDVRDNRGRRVYERRSDAFQVLHSSGGLSLAEFTASQRYWAAWVTRAGAGDPPPAGSEVIDGARGSAELVTGRMIQAGREIELAHQLVGRADARLLAGLVEPLVMRGEIRVWRVLVQQLTGETERHAQAARVRGACQNLVLAWPEVDRKLREKPRLPAA